MPTLHTFALFATAAVIFAAVPGPAVFYIVTRSVSQGRRAGVLSASAIATGTLVHVAAAAVGLSALIASSAVAFTVVKYLGAAYLIYLGIQAMRSGREGAGHGLDAGAQRPGRIYRQGVVVAVLNPKTALFFLAFLPQFVDPSRGAVTPQLLVLGVMLVAIAFVSDCCYALLTGTVGGWVRERASRVWRGGRYVTGGAYVSLGVAAAVTGDRP